MDLLFAALLASLGIGLDVEAPPDCIMASELEAAVEAEIGPFAANARIRIEHESPSGWRARIFGAGGVRTIEEPSDDCRALDRALVLVIALMAEKPPPSPPPEREPAAPVRDEIASVRFGLDAALAVGALPTPAPGGRINGAIGFPLGPMSLWIEAGFTGWRPTERMISQASQTIESSTKRFDGDLALCSLVPLERSIEIGACAGARFGRLSVGGEINETIKNSFNEDQTFTRGGEDARFLFAVSTELRAAWKPIDEMVLVLAAGGSFDLLDNAISVAGVPEISGNPADRLNGVFRAGIQWEVW